MLETMVKGIYGVSKKDSVRLKRGQEAKTVIVKVMCSIDPSPSSSSSDLMLLWNAIVNWKEGGIHKKYVIAGELGDIVHQVTRLVMDALIDLMGRVQEVDVVYRMPSGKDHKTTVTFKNAMRSVEQQQ